MIRANLNTKTDPVLISDGSWAGSGQSETISCNVDDYIYIYDYTSSISLPTVVSGGTIISTENKSVIVKATSSTVVVTAQGTGGLYIYGVFR